MNVRVIVADAGEELSWTSQLKYPFVVLSVKNIPEDSYPNLGREFYLFYDWILRNYDKLPDYLILAHSHRTSWHNKVPQEKLINSLIFDKKYWNYNDFTGYIESYNYLTLEGLNKERNHPFFEIYFNEKHKELCELLQIPEIQLKTIRAKRCGQFYVHRDLIQQYSFDFWRRFVKFSGSIPKSIQNSHPDVIDFFRKNEAHSMGFVNGHYFELVNHWLFTHCQDYDYINTPEPQNR